MNESIFLTIMMLLFFFIGYGVAKLERWYNKPQKEIPFNPRLDNHFKRYK